MMRQLWHDILTHRLVATLVALCWLGIGVISVVMWSQGAPGGLPDAQLLVVVIASVIVGWWRVPATARWDQAHITDSMRHGLVAAALLMWLTLATNSLLMALFAPANEPPVSMPWTGAVLLWLLFALLYGIMASVAGLIGGLIGGGLAYVFHRWRHRGGPAAPAGVS